MGNLHALISLFDPLTLCCRYSKESSWWADSFFSIHIIGFGCIIRDILWVYSNFGIILLGSRNKRNENRFGLWNTIQVLSFEESGYFIFLIMALCFYINSWILLFGVVGLYHGEIVYIGKLYRLNKPVLKHICLTTLRASSPVDTNTTLNSTFKNLSSRRNEFFVCV